MANQPSSTQPTAASVVQPADVTPGGLVKGINVGTGMELTDILRPVLGGQRGGVHYQPDPALDAPGMQDLLVYVMGPMGFPLAIGYVASPLPGDNVVLPDLVEGELLIFHKSGSYIKLRDDGNVEVRPAPGGQVLLGVPGGTSKPVARQGDAVSVNVSTGIGTITGGSTSTEST